MWLKPNFATLALSVRQGPQPPNLKPHTRSAEEAIKEDTVTWHKCSSTDDSGGRKRWKCDFKEDFSNREIKKMTFDWLTKSVRHVSVYVG